MVGTCIYVKVCAGIHPGDYVKHGIELTVFFIEVVIFFLDG
jgi:hypothetical protein